jgi:hypothetical protein
MAGGVHQATSFISSMASNNIPFVDIFAKQFRNAFFQNDNHILYGTVQVTTMFSNRA